MRKSSNPRAGSGRRTFPALEPLEGRIVPTVTIDFDFSHDSQGFFQNSAAKSALEAAGDLLASHLNDSLAAIVPSGTVNTWSESTFNPSDPNEPLTVNDPTVPANTLVIYAGGSALVSGEGGLGGTGFSSSGTADWNNLVEARGQSGALNTPATDNGPWGGAVSFSTSVDWNYAIGSPTTPGGNFFGVALHEISHVLGIGTANSWYSDVNKTANLFIGAHADAVYGAEVPLDPGTGIEAGDPDAHWALGTTSGGHVAVMTPTAGDDLYTALDWAGLNDVGWQDNTLAISAQPSSAMVGSPFVVTVEALYPDGTLDTGYDGTITLAIGNNPGSATLGGTTKEVAIRGVATFPAISIGGAGSGYTLVASDGQSFSGTSAPISTGQPTLTSISASPTILAFGQSTTLAAQVSLVGATSPTPAGTVTFTDGPTVLGSEPVNGSGATTLVVPSLGLGSHPITATYSGNATDAGSAASLSLYVGDSSEEDFDGDGKSDLTTYGLIPGTNLYGFTILTSSSNFTKTVVWDNQGFGFGNPSSIPVVGDYFGDGRDDYAIWSPDGHGFMMLQVISSVNPAKALSIDFGLMSDVPVVADVDGDGKDDFGVFGFDPNLGYRYDFLLSSRNFSTSQPLIFNNYGYGYGTPGATPVVADFDGSGHAGFGVYIPSGTTGTFTFTQVAIPKNSTGPIVNPVATDYFARTYGFATDDVTAVDYDGDGKAGLAFYGLDPRTGRYRYDILTSSSDFDQDVYFDNAGFGYGYALSIPVMADYEGNGRADFAAYQPDGLGHAEFVFQDVGVGHGVVYDFATPDDLPLTAPAWLLAKKVRQG